MFSAQMGYTFDLVCLLADDRQLHNCVATHSSAMVYSMPAKIICSVSLIAIIPRTLQSHAVTLHTNEDWRILLLLCLGQRHEANVPQLGGYRAFIPAEPDKIGLQVYAHDNWTSKISIALSF